MAGVGGALDERAPVRKDGERVRWMAEAEQQGIEADSAMGLEPGGEGGKIHGTAVLVNLDGVASAEGNVGAELAAKVPEIAGRAADGAVWSRDGGSPELGVFVGPEVMREQGTAHRGAIPGEEFEGLCGLKRGDEVDGHAEDACGFAGFDRTCRWGGKDAGQAGGFAGQDVH